MKKFALVMYIFLLCVILSFGNPRVLSFSQELQDAYSFAYKNKITTQDSIDKADMNGGLTRIAMAKMLSQYAINILGKSPDTSKIPKFGDVDSKLDGDYNNGVTLAYQLGIMGIGIDKFRPFDTVTRAEFGTALSRVLYGDKYEGGSQYYINHLNALKTVGIMTKIDNPLQNEIRGFVMLMLMRANYTKDRIIGREQFNESYEEHEIDNFNEEIEIRSIKKDYDEVWAKNTRGIIRGDKIAFYKHHYPANKVTLIFKLIGNIQKEQIEFIEFGYEDWKNGGHNIITKNYDKDKITNGEIHYVLMGDINDIGRNIKYNNIESLGTTVGLELVKISDDGVITNIKKNGYSENLYEVPMYSSREINIYSNGSDNIDFDKGISYFRSIMKDKYQSIGEFTIEHGEGKENAYLREILFNYSGNIDLSQAIDDIKLCNGHTRQLGTACVSIPTTYIVKDKNTIDIKLNDKISASKFSIFAKFKNLMYVGNNWINLSVNGPENFRIEMEDGSDPFYNKFSFEGLYTTIKGRDKSTYEKEFGKLFDDSNDGNNSTNESTSSSNNNTSNNGNGDDSELNDNSGISDDSSNDNPGNDSSSNDSSSNDNSSNDSSSNDNCVDIEVDDGKSYSFCITKWKDDGSKYSVSIDNANDLGLCSVGRKGYGSSWNFYDCKGNITGWKSSGTYDLSLSISYNKKTYTKSVEYDLTNGIFVDS